jgi:hypothetical protein
MKSSEMTCVKCLGLGPKGCHRSPIPFWHNTVGLDVRDHWCLQGVWWDEELGYPVRREEAEDAHEHRG